MNDTQAAVQLPRWRSHKEVHADKIVDITKSVSGDFIRLTLACRGYVDLAADASIFKRGMPDIGWYYVVYADGYKSLSPADAFEEGYTNL